MDFGVDGNFGGGDDFFYEVSFIVFILLLGKWVSLDIFLVDFVGLVNCNNIV